MGMLKRLGDWIRDLDDKSPTKPVTKRAVKPPVKQKPKEQQRYVWAPFTPHPNDRLR